MSPAPIILWFRRDLRLEDHAALSEALKGGSPILPLYIHETETVPSMGAASQWWLHHALQAHEARLRALEARLIVRQGDPAKVLAKLIAETGAKAVYASRAYDRSTDALDHTMQGFLDKRHITWKTFGGHLMWEPTEVRNKSGKPFQVFTPFWRAQSQGFEPGKPLPAPTHWPSPQQWPASDPLESLHLLPSISWDAGWKDIWQPGEKGAAQAVERFASEAYETYEVGRDLPGIEGTSRLSPHLHFGEITPAQIYHGLLKRLQPRGVSPTALMSSCYMRELGWREFAHHLLHHFPDTTDRPLRPEFEAFPWMEEEGLLRAWQKGQTGYPMVDAGMRELWSTGWMHNRVRMIVGSFLVKHLLIRWQEGAKWFWDTLVDADLANNTLGWQWIAGCGADAAPYFRIFNPMTQSEKFDGHGDYIRRWVPELAKLSDADLHAPWEVPPLALASAGIQLGVTYPHPVVNHTIARERALAAYQKIKKAR